MSARSHPEKGFGVQTLPDSSFSSDILGVLRRLQDLTGSERTPNPCIFSGNKQPKPWTTRWLKTSIRTQLTKPGQYDFTRILPQNTGCTNATETQENDHKSTCIKILEACKKEIIKSLKEIQGKYN